MEWKCEIPENLYIGFREEDGEKKGNMISAELVGLIEEDDYTELEEWRDWQISPMSVDNEPISGFKIEGAKKDFTGKNVYKIIDPRGFFLYIESETLTNVITNATIVKGTIQDRCCWAYSEMSGWAEYLIVEGSETYKKNKNNKDHVMDSQLEETIKEAVDQLVSSEEMFTAYDVSKGLQDAGIRERHLRMKGVIHLRMEEHKRNFVAYSKTLIPIPNTNDAWLYHPDGADVDDYEPKSRSNNSAPAQTGSSNIVPVPASVIKSSGGNGVVHLRSKNRILIPNGFMRSANMNPGDIAYLYVEDDIGEAVCISSNKPSNPDDVILERYIVDKSGNIRIGLDKLIKACFDPDASVFEVSQNGQVLELSIQEEDDDDDDF